MKLVKLNKDPKAQKQGGPVYVNPALVETVEPGGCRNTLIVTATGQRWIVEGDFDSVAAMLAAAGTESEAGAEEPTEDEQAASGGARRGRRSG